MYASYTPRFHFESDGTPVGGFFRDGRAATLAIQAQAPFLTSFEMANGSADEVVQRLKTRPYLQDFIALYGADALNDPAAAMADIGAALAAYETEDADFHPFTSKYDYWRNGQAPLSAAEQRGLQVFNDPTRGNCAACHPSTSADGVTPPLFTDFTYDNLGVPRNPDIAANDDLDPPPYVPYNGAGDTHAYYDQGLCGPLRTDLPGNTAALCGAFKVPTLRNVAVTAPYFHNGRFATLTEALAFYITRDTDPARWYPTDGAGNVTKFDDLEAAYGGEFGINVNLPGSDASYLGNVNTGEIPYNRKLGQAPALTDAQIGDLVAFLCTLTDGYDPQRPEAYTLPAQCPQSTGSSSAASGN
jgi:cytochrome c peroxidase